jgi:hypothetical protein
MVVETRSSGYYRNDKTFKMPAGKYFVGDLQYVINEKDFYDMKVEMKGTLRNGRKYLNFYCDDDYPWDDTRNKGFHVRSGTMGLTLIDGLEDQWVKFHCYHVGDTPAETTMLQYIEKVGHIIDFPTDFECSKLILSHNRRDEITVQLDFDEKVSVWWREGCYNSSDCDSEENA